jgi:hypothetical protein
LIQLPDGTGEGSHDGGPHGRGSQMRQRVDEVSAASTWEWRRLKRAGALAAPGMTSGGKLSDRGGT